MLRPSFSTLPVMDVKKKTFIRATIPSRSEQEIADLSPKKKSNF